MEVQNLDKDLNLKDHFGKILVGFFIMLIIVIVNFATLFISQY